MGHYLAEMEPDGREKFLADISGGRQKHIGSPIFESDFGFMLQCLKDAIAREDAPNRGQPPQ